MDRDEMAAIALRYDTVMSRALLRALGIDAPKPRRSASAKVDRYACAAKLMKQRTGVRM